MHIKCLLTGYLIRSHAVFVFTQNFLYFQISYILLLIHLFTSNTIFPFLILPVAVSLDLDLLLTYYNMDSCIIFKPYHTNNFNNSPLKGIKKNCNLYSITNFYLHLTSQHLKEDNPEIKESTILIRRVAKFQ